MKIRPCALGSTLTFIEAKAASRNFVDEHDLPERTNAVALGAAGPIKKWQTDFLFDYQIFPTTIVRFEAEWKKEGREMAMGDVILQRAVMPPIGFGLCLEFAVRVRALIREEKRLGFAYETLSGHAESGVSEFYFEEREGQLFFVIHTFSRPGHWTSRIAKHIFTLPYQRWCTRRALANVRRHFLARNPEANQSPQPAPVYRRG
jgi:uncharacterized protein (UPF0548 family)